MTPRLHARGLAPAVLASLLTFACGSATTLDDGRTADAGTPDGAASTSTPLDASLAVDASPRPFDAGPDPALPDASDAHAEASVPDAGCVRTAPGARPIQISAGAGETCALMSDTTVTCWGAGFPGDGTLDAHTTPTQVPCLHDVIQVSVGAGHTCAARKDGAVLCWGDNSDRQIGITTLDQVLVPTVVVGVTGVAEVSAGQAHTCARRAVGTVACWGADTNGQVGAAWDGHSVPPDVPEIDDAVELVTGAQHSCVRRAGGTIRCWGANSDLERGDGVPHEYGHVQSSTEGVVDAIQVTANEGSYTCARLTGGKAMCWGSAWDGQIGDGTAPYTEPPTAVSGGDALRDLSAGANFTCGVWPDETVRCWGSGDNGALGDGYASHPLPRPVPGVSNVVRVTAGFRHTCALLADSSVACWGDNTGGQLGDGTTTSRFTPAPVRF